MKKSVVSLLTVILLSMASSASADVIEGKSLKGARGFDVEADLRNDRATFSVRVAVDREDRIYEKGDLMHVTVRSEKGGYLYLLYRQADGSTKCLFPNLYESDNKIRGRREITIPTAKQGFRLRCSAPFGEELLVAIVTERPVAVERLGVKSLTKSVLTDVDIKTFVRGIRKGMEVVSAASGGKPGKWAEHMVQIKTVAKGRRSRSVHPKRRIGLFIGISKYRDSRIRDLHLCHKDAIVMAMAMKKYGKLDGIGLLIDEKATRQNIEKAFRELKHKSNPGDEIFIYWSGHGGICADTGGDEADGRDEFLVPHDGKLEKIEETMILDDALGRWIQELDGRKVVIILDACHSGGQAEGKGLDFLDSELGRIKDIGQKDAAMLFSSASDEISAERRDDKLSVMTYFLVMKMAASESLTLEEAYDYVKVEVPKYMKKHFPGRTQTPQLCPQDGADVKLR